MEIEVFREDVNPEKWDCLLSRCAHDVHNIYQTREWAGLMKRSHGMTPFFVVLSQDNRLYGGHVYFKKKILKTFTSIESSGGPLCIDDSYWRCSEEAILEQLLTDTDRPLYILTRPRMLPGSSSQYADHGFQRSKFYTILLSLAPQKDRLWAGLSQNARRGVRKAEKLGIVVKEARDWKLWKDFYSIHRSHSRNRRIAAKNIDFFEELYTKFLPKEMAELLVAFDGGSVVGGMLFLSCRGTLTYYIGASDDGCACSPHDILFWNAISLGNEKGLATFDLGDTWPNPKSHLYSIHMFKEKWGGTLVENSFYIRGRMYRFGRDLVLNNRPIQTLYESLHQSEWI